VALNEYYLAKKNVATQEVIVKTLKSQREGVNIQKTNFETNCYQDQAKLEELNQKISGVSGLVKQIETSKTEITALENDLKIINQHHESTLLKLNCNKALSFLDWHTTMNFKETIKMTAEWYQSFYSNSEQILDVTNEQIEKYTSLAKSKGLQWAQ
jgi:nucleoside-diphosphate-sugar epimerase